MDVDQLKVTKTPQLRIHINIHEPFGTTDKG